MAQLLFVLGLTEQAFGEKIVEMVLAPIILFAYKRPEHMKTTLDALGKNSLAKESDLFIYVDGLKKSPTAEDKKLHQEVITLSNEFTGCRSTKVIVSESNKGLAASVIEGVTDLVNQFGKVIVLEDDLVTSPFFLEFMNNALHKYAGSSEVACISGYVYPLANQPSEAFFIKGADCWGWATWSEKWKLFRNEPAELYNALIEKNQSMVFDFNGTYPYMNMLKERSEGKNQSWAILWYASAFLKGKYCLYPPKSFVLNIGNDGSGTHNVDSTNKFDGALNKGKLPFLPDSVSENVNARKAFEDFFSSLKNNTTPSLLQRIKNKISSLIK